VKLILKIAAVIGAALAAQAASAQQPAPAPATAPAAPIAAALAAQPENVWHLDLSTGGRVTILLRPDVAPAHVARIRALTRQGFYNGTTFHRVIPGFMAQGGDPTGTGQGGSPLPDLAAEFNELPHLRGAVAMARTAEPNSANSQFYIMLGPRFSLDRQYTVFGRVVSGMGFVDAIVPGEPPVNRSTIVRASIGADNVPPPSAEELRAAAAAAAPPPPPSVLVPTGALAPPPR
jgi:peptidylprolyl isomerase